jgi:phosphoenolpyruvate carboxykinase (GTP)
VNWFRKDKDGKYLWPGYGQNMRMLKWVIERIYGEVVSIESPIGWVPQYEDIDWGTLNFTHEQFEEVMDIDREAWKNEILTHEELFCRMYDKLPKEFFFMRELLLSSLWRSTEHTLAPETH